MERFFALRHRHIWHLGTNGADGHVMLMLSRRPGERIVIDGVVEVVVAEIRKRVVRIGVVGGRETQILRGEVFDAIKAANEAALSTQLSEDDVTALLDSMISGSEEPEGEEGEAVSVSPGVGDA